MGISDLLQQEERILDNIRFSLMGLQTAIPPGGEKELSQKVVYASSPITSGARLYGLYRECGVCNMDELEGIEPGTVKNRLIKPNVDDGIRFGEEIRKYGVGQVIVPGVFFAKGWTQEHYMSLWEQVITRYSDIVCFNRDFHYSNGCVEELLIGLQHGKELRHRENFRLLDPREEVGRIHDAIEEIDGLGVDVKKLYNLYRRVTLFLEGNK
jgi:hypothetical protein